MDGRMQQVIVVSLACICLGARRTGAAALPVNGVRPGHLPGPGDPRLRAVLPCPRNHDCISFGPPRSCDLVAGLEASVSMKLKTTLPLERAEQIVDVALRHGRDEGMLPLSVVVLDAGGKVVACKSEDGSGILRFDIAHGKAWGALGMGMSSRLIRDRLSRRPAFQNALAAASEGRFIPVPGGVLIEDADGHTIGAVGISGDTSERDEYCAVAAVAAAGLVPEPSEADPNWRMSSLSDRSD